MPSTESMLEAQGVFLHAAAFNVNVGGLTLYVLPDEASANQVARLLNMARESKHHSGMNILTTQLFLAEDTAKFVLHMLHEEGQPIGVGNGKPN